mgnify:FL=1|tara:strand:+ start:239 stop:505 length:267 start_codon:yes stop_codon:yes gene_type:complete
MDTKYNGWTNYATWRVNLEIFDGQTARDCGWSPGGSAYDFSKGLKDYAAQIIEDTSTEGLARDYALAFLSDVDWREIAERLLSDEAAD